MGKLRDAAALTLFCLSFSTAALQAAPNEFYLNLMHRGMSHVESGQYEIAAHELRIAAFGFLGAVPQFETAHVYLTIALSRIGQDAEARRSIQKILSAERIEKRYGSLAIPISARAEFEQIVSRLFPGELAVLRSSPARPPVQTTPVPPPIPSPAPAPPAGVRQSSNATTPAVEPPQKTASPSAQSLKTLPPATPAPFQAAPDSPKVPEESPAPAPAPPAASKASPQPNPPAEKPTTQKPADAATPPPMPAPVSKVPPQQLPAPAPRVVAPTAPVVPGLAPPAAAAASPVTGQTSIGASPASPAPAVAQPAASVPKAPVQAPPATPAPQTSVPKATPPSPAPAPKAAQPAGPLTQILRPAPPTGPAADPKPAVTVPAATRTVPPQAPTAPVSAQGISPSVTERLLAATTATESGDFAMASKMYRSLAADPAVDRSTLLRVAIATSGNGDYRTAVQAFGRVGTFAAGEESHRYLFAVALYETGKYAAAKRELAAALPHIQRTPDVAKYRSKIEGALE